MPFAPCAVAAVAVALAAAPDDRMFFSVGPDGTAVVTDYPRPDAQRYRPGDFERIALGQTNEAHRGLGAFDDGAVLFEAPRAPAELAPLIAAAARKHALPAPLLLAVIAVESRFDKDAVSRAGAQGLMQLMPGTARDMGVKDPFDAADNIEGGARYLAFLRKHFKDDALALAAYNAGPGRVARAGGIPDIPETRAYVDQVLALAGAYGN